MIVNSKSPLFGVSILLISHGTLGHIMNLSEGLLFYKSREFLFYLPPMTNKLKHLNVEMRPHV